MPEHYVVDMSHYVDVDWSVVRDPRPLERTIAYFASVVEAATASPHAGRPWQSPLPCPRRPARRPCGGRFVLTRWDAENVIEWECPMCGESGVARGWRRTVWDLEDSRVDRDGALFFTLEAVELAALLDDPLLDEAFRAVLRAGELLADGTVSLCLPEAEQAFFVDETSALANHCESKARRRRLERVSERMEKAGRSPLRLLAGDRRVRAKAERKERERFANLDREKLEEVALALLSLTFHADDRFTRAWKGLDWELMDDLHERRWIHDPKGKARSVVMTDEGARLAHEFLEKHFGVR